MWHVYVGMSKAEVHGAAGRACCFEAANADGSLVSRCLQWIAATKRWQTPKASVWLSGALARPFTIGPVAGVRSWSEARACALASAPAACGLSNAASPVLNGWPESRAVLAVAAEQQLLDEVRRAATAWRVRVASVRPWWTLACDAVCRGEANAAGFIAEEEDGLTALAAADSRWIAAATCTPKPDEASARAFELRLTATGGFDEANLAHASWIGEPQQQRWPCIRWRKRDVP